MANQHGWRGFATGILLDAINGAEYSALPDPAKDGVRIIISAGFINFVENSPMWNALHSIFPDGTTTWTNILAATLWHSSDV